MPTATFVTSLGTFKVKLFPETAPKTVENFIDLATGAKEYKDPRDGSRKSDPYYDGTIFHRVIKDFMIQGGDPTGTGRGGPGYDFEDEFPAGGPSFSKKGLLAMANAGPNTNGSQFFVTTSTPTYLNSKHTIFGEVTEGYDVIEAIESTDADRNDRPKTEVVIEKVTIEP